MNLTPNSKKKFAVSKTEKPNKSGKFTARIIKDDAKVREWAGQKYKQVSFSPLSLGTKVMVCDAILSENGNVWYYIKYKDHYGFIYGKRIAHVPSMALKIVQYLDNVHWYIKDHYKYFINEYDSDIVAFNQVKSRVSHKKEVGITCVVPLRFALYYYGIKNANKKSLISAPGGSFEKYYTGGVKSNLTRITSGGPVGKTVKQAVDQGLLIDGDIVCYKNLTHTSVFSGK